MRQQVLWSREENQEAFQVMQDQGVELVVPPQDEIQSFKQLVQDSIPELVGQAFSRESFEQVQLHLSNFRQQQVKSDAP